jgi:hypothetical protein
VVRELHPEVLNRSGLKAAIEQLAHGVSERYGLAVDLDTDGWPDGARTELDQILFGCAREITTNVGKHAEAHTVSIGLDLDKNAGMVADRRRRRRHVRRGTSRPPWKPATSAWPGSGRRCWPPTARSTSTPVALAQPLR